MRLPMPAKYTHTSIDRISAAYERGFKSASKGSANNNYSKSAQLALYCAFEAGVSDFEAGYKLDLSVFK